MIKLRICLVAGLILTLFGCGGGGGESNVG